MSDDDGQLSFDLEGDAFADPPQRQDDETLRMARASSVRHRGNHLPPA